MSQYFFTPLSFQAARNRYRDRLQELDAVAFPDGNQSLLNEGMSPEEADEALVNALESRLHQGTVSGNLSFFAGTFSGGKVRLDGKTVREMILSIAENRELLERGIRNHFSGDAVRVIAGILAAGGAGFLCRKLSVSAAKSSFSKKALKTLSVAWKSRAISGKAPLSVSAPVLNRLRVSAQRLAMPLANVPNVSGEADNTRFLILPLALIVAAAMILGIVGVSKKGGRRVPVRIGPGIRNEKEAREVLTLAECLADIYRDERD